MLDLAQATPSMEAERAFVRAAMEWYRSIYRDMDDIDFAITVGTYCGIDGEGNLMQMLRVAMYG